jgi:hypothetical protein
MASSQWKYRIAENQIEEDAALLERWAAYYIERGWKCKDQNGGVAGLLIGVALQTGATYLRQASEPPSEISVATASPHFIPY